MKMPKILQDVMQSDAYINRNNPDYATTNARAGELLTRFYPGKLKADATGKFTAPGYKNRRR